MMIIKPKTIARIVIFMLATSLEIFHVQALRTVTKNTDSSLYNGTGKDLDITIIQTCREIGNRSYLRNLPNQTSVFSLQNKTSKEFNFSRNLTRNGNQCSEFVLLIITEKGKVIFSEMLQFPGDFHIYFNEQTKQYELVEVMA